MTGEAVRNRHADSNEEAEWLLKAQRGDTEAFSMLVDIYQRPVYNLCYRMLGESFEAEDAAQETFLRAYNNLKKYDNGRSFSTWLLSVAAHYCIDQIRKRRMVMISLDDLPYLEPHDHGPGPEASLGQLEQQNRVKKLLDSLRPKDRAAVVMFYWYDFSYEEIATTLALSVSAVKSRLHRARLSLSKTWIEQEAQMDAAKAAAMERTSNGKAQSPAFQ
jgi:RNA polymerase sigma-70 factor (ECF subfamily)